jgi:predicted DNA binding CopG/RHH family protein
MKKSQLDLPVEMLPAVAPLAPLAPFNAAVSAAINAHGDAAANGHAGKTEDRRQNNSYFAQKPLMQTIPVKLPDNVIELLKGQARQRGVSLQTLIKATLAASVSVSVVEEP